MATFNAKAFEKKLNGMDLSQTSVQTVSLWIIHHKQNIKEVIGVWVDMMKKGNVWEIHQSIWHVTKETGRADEEARGESYRAEATGYLPRRSFHVVFQSLGIKHHASKLICSSH